jgi:4,5:9,10-diseco-3-hydroxy-5,9,17-trioxoandrosta-1(10),2-diene-4-oate hydrolase
MLKRDDQVVSPPEGISEKWTQVEGLRVRFWQAGSGHAIVLVHGLLGYSFNWRRVIPDLAKSHKVFVPDLPGAGFSECSSALDCRLSASARRLLAFLDGVGIDSCDLVGSSYGGATAILAAALQPSCVRRLVLVSPANPWSGVGRKRLRLLRIPAIAACFPTISRWSRPLQGYFVRRMYGDPTRLTAETLQSHFKPLSRPGVLEHAVGIVKTWWEDMAELEATLPKISKIPTLLIWGSRDKTVDPASAFPLSCQFESAEMKILEGVGHLPYEECPQEFMTIVEPFLQAGLVGTRSLGGAREVT